ncbi:hypothetical protein AnigIFM60653_004579 [Aspergillus niger]|nr:hypothetical protein AnigIFM50267_001479 [Aspergillus niger]GLA04529.1 hypothetical protein AnigIFM60653_004579 [Aspergillus niger]GLA33368.1 hypothetical protein AnigIFM63309_000191 [Aspergillus niger]
MPALGFEKLGFIAMQSGREGAWLGASRKHILSDVTRAAFVYSAQDEELRYLTVTGVLQPTKATRKSGRSVSSKGHLQSMLPNVPATLRTRYSSNYEPPSRKHPKSTNYLPNLPTLLEYLQ